MVLSYTIKQTKLLSIRSRNEMITYNAHIANILLHPRSTYFGYGDRHKMAAHVGGSGIGGLQVTFEPTIRKSVSESGRLFQTA